MIEFLQANNITSAEGMLLQLKTQPGAEVLEAVNSGASWVFESWPNETAILRHLWDVVREHNTTLLSSQPEASANVTGALLSGNATLIYSAEGVSASQSSVCASFFSSGAPWTIAYAYDALTFLQRQPSPVCWWDFVCESVGMDSLRLFSDWAVGLITTAASLMAPATAQPLRGNESSIFQGPGVLVWEALPTLKSVRGVAGALANSSYTVLNAGRRVMLSALVYALSFSSSVFEFSVSCLLFVNVTYYLLAARQSWLRQVLGAVLPPADCAHALGIFSNAVQQVLLVNIKASIYHGLFTYLILSLAGTHFVGEVDGREARGGENQGATHRCS